MHLDLGRISERRWNRPTGGRSLFGVGHPAPPGLALELFEVGGSTDNGPAGGHGGGLELEARLTDAQCIAGFHPHPTLDPFAVQPGAVGRPEILDFDVAFARVDLEVPPGDLSVPDRHVGIDAAQNRLGLNGERRPS